MREQPTQSERRLQLLIEQSHPELLVISQFVIQHYIADFCIPNLKLVIEVDGASHSGRETYDRKRDLYMEREGYRVLRFTNSEVFYEPKQVIRRIERML